MHGGNNRWRMLRASLKHLRASFKHLTPALFGQSHNSISLSISNSCAALTNAPLAGRRRRARRRAARSLAARPPPAAAAASA